MAEETFDIKKVLSKPLKTDNESEERICWGKEFQMVGAAKENDLRSISDRPISDRITHHSIKFRLGIIFIIIIKNNSLSKFIKELQMLNVAVNQIRLFLEIF